MRSEALLASDTTGYAEWTLHLDDPGTVLLAYDVGAQRSHLFVLALCVTGCLAVAMYPSRVPPDRSVEAVSQLLDAAVHRILWGRGASSDGSGEP